MDFKRCKYYEEAIQKEHCPFDKTCSDECYFSQKVWLQDFEELREDYTELQSDYWNLEAEERNITEYEEMNERLETSLRELLRLFQYSLNHPQEDLFNVIDNFELLDSTSETLEMIREAKPMLNIDIVCDNVKYMPEYANTTDACMDLKIKTETITLNPGESKVFETGIKVKIPENYFMSIYPRSSTGFKLSCMLANTVGIIDSGYRDEVKLKLFNFGKEPIELTDGQRVAQFVILPRPQIKLTQVEDDEEFKNGYRGGGIGSTGK